MRIFATLAVAISLLVAVQLRSEQGPGVVSGVVINAAGAPIGGVLVELRIGPRVVQSVTTSARGVFRFDNVPEGTYEVRVSKGGQAAIRPLTVGRDRLSPMRITLSNPAARDEARKDSPAVGNAPAAMIPAPPMEVQAYASARAMPTLHRAMPRPNTEAYDRIDESGYRRVADHPLSTFSIDVDTASYSNVRRFLKQGGMPPADAVRIEELINYFRFDYAVPKNADPFAVTTEVAACPWNPAHRIALVGLKARPIADDRTPARNLVFLLDVSGSMDEPDKLPLVQTAMRMLADTLTASDRVAIVVYAGASGLVLPSTTGDRKTEIQQAIADLTPGGSTNGAAGIRLAYDTAAAHFIKGGINRVILATDGDFNVGVTSEGELTRLIETRRESGVFLSVLGVGTGNLKDSTMEKLADRGNGNYAYLDSLQEARRVLIAEAGSTLVTVAKDVKIQVEFNPRKVGAYRLIGYENRLMANEDFNNDKKDAGEIGAGHSVTALYEIVPPGAPIDTATVDPLKYQKPAPSAGSGAESNELLTLKLRYKAPDGDTSRLMTVAVDDRTSALTSNLGFAAAVAEFGFLLRNSEHKGQATWASARALASSHRGNDPDGYRAELMQLIDLAAALDRQQSSDSARRR